MNKPWDITYDFHPERFIGFTSKHRQHQHEAIASMKDQDIGQVSIPTGTGKTRIQADMHVRSMLEMTERGEFGVFLIASHRLLLNQQLLDDLEEEAVKCGVPYDSLHLGSDRIDETAKWHRYAKYGLTSHVNRVTVTLRSEDVLDAYESAQRDQRQLLIVSTYQSFSRLNLLPRIDLCTYDEAHTTVTETFRESLMEIRPAIRRNFFFTATRKVAGEDFGMNDRSFYGPVLYERSPKEMVEVGEIVGPRIHLINTSQSDEERFDNPIMTVKTVTQAFERHKEMINRVSATPGKLGAKLLVSVRGNEDLQTFLTDPQSSPLFREWCAQHPNVRVFAFSSLLGSFENFQQGDRTQIYRRMQALTNEEDAILLHIEILTEGIDLPSITGVMPFRGLSTVKLLQTIGRSARLLLEDRLRLYEGSLHPSELEKFVKPVCWVLFPSHIQKPEDRERMTQMVVLLRESYGVPVEEMIIEDEYLANEDDNPLRVTRKDQARRRFFECELEHLLEDVRCQMFMDSLTLIPSDQRSAHVRNLVRQYAQQVLDKRKVAKETKGAENHADGSFTEKLLRPLLALLNNGDNA